MERHILVILPHPDDESFGFAGTILKHKEQRTRVTYLCLTLGEMGRNMGNPPFSNRETIPEIRKKELQEACRVLKIDELRMMGLRDKTIEFLNQEKLAQSLATIIQDVDPSLILTFYPGYSVHPDHDSCGAAVMRAVALLPKEKRPIVHALAISPNSIEDLGEPDIVHDISDFIETKLEALRAHRSQMQEVVKATEHKLEQGIEDWMKYERFWIYDIDA